MKYKIYLIISTCALSYSILAEEPVWIEQCKPLENAIETASRLKKVTALTLENVFEANRKVRECDDGAYGEGMSDLTARALAGDFKSVVTRAGQNQSFLEFVLNHIDATADLNDLNKISENAKKLCPKKFAVICKQLGEKGSKASADITSTK